DRRELGRLVDRLYRRFGNTRTATVLDKIKALGFHYATTSGTTVALEDIVIPDAKKALIEKAEQEVEQVERQHRRGLITAEERYQQIVAIWTDTKDAVTEAMETNL